jgi:hypothetical protein
VRVIKRISWCLAMFVLLLVGAETRASDVRFFSMNTRDAFLEGELDGVSVGSLGTLQLANRVARVGEVDEPFVFAAVAHPQGWVLATGNSGRVLLLDRAGVVSTLLEADEPTIFAVAVDASGVVYAGASPGGVVYRIKDQVAKVYYRSEETYIWAMAAVGDALWLATGTEGHLHRVDADGSGEIVLDVDDVHLRSLAPLPGGEFLIGTSGEGLVLTMDASGRARTLYDAGLDEIVDLERGANGFCYAAVTNSQAGYTDVAPPGGSQNGAGSAAVTVVEQEGATVTVSNGVAGPRSKVLRFPCAGGVMETLWTFTEETIYDLLWAKGRLWIGTGQDGKLFSLEDGTLVLEKDVGERQIVSVMADDHGPALATTNAAAVYRVLDEPEQEGVYNSPALDAGQIAEFGTLHWRGGKGGSIRFAFRSGMSSEPDTTWSPWSVSAAGREVSLGDVPPGRFLQFRAEMASQSPSPTLTEVTVSYRQKNLAPVIQKLEVLPAGQVLVPANFNPASQVFEPVSPNREGIFTSLAPERDRENQRLKGLWKRGYRTLQWEANDPNEDQLTYRLDFRPEDSAESWFPIVDSLTDAYFSFDATVLADGVYRFRVTASDEAGNSNGRTLAGERTSGPVTVDHTPPVLGNVERQSQVLRVVVADAMNALRQADYSLDGESWVAAEPTDGLLDGRQETFEIDPGEGTELVLFRVMDSFFNLTTFDLRRGQR